ncbi:type II toxin-antitoxin system RelE/ParE family toxin [candidate division KSB1 bacterium]|nr:type II toxin-antitoxin system RelE/ParE family toxin [candidate division KSB1 bacterium]
MNYQVIIPKPVQKQLDILPDNIFRRIIYKLETLRENPRPVGIIKLKGFKNEYRIRVGDYRIRYEILDEQKIVLLLHCKHRKDIYR